jgi:chromosome segregation ATPase
VVGLDGSATSINQGRVDNSRNFAVLYGNIMKITKIAVDCDQNQRKIDKLERQIDDLKREYKKSEKEFSSDIKEIKKAVKDIEKTLKDLNIGKRLFFQQKTVFNSLQRKIEKLETVQNEWKNFKETIDDKVKKMISKHNRTRVQV